MVQSIMYIGMGFLLAAIIAVAVMPAVHDRAVRITTRRLRAILPESAEEIHAQKDLQRAEFAMSMRRLEMGLERVRDESVNRAVELAKGKDLINRLKGHRDGLKVEVVTLKAQDDKLRAEIESLRSEIDKLMPHQNQKNAVAREEAKTSQRLQRSRRSRTRSSSRHPFIST
jgi:septal ring factor EnvC (AmiA/AmiB activator)